MPARAFILLILTVLLAAGVTVAVALSVDLPAGVLGEGTLGLGALVAALAVGLLSGRWTRR